MSTAKATLNANTREKSGKGVARTLRRAGNVPAIIYGKDHAPLSLSLSLNELTQQYIKGRFTSRTLMLDIDSGKEKFQALPCQVQVHPVTDQIEHVDFLKVDDNSRILIDVPLRFVGKERCIGIKRGGSLNAVRHAIELFCTPTTIPDTIEIDVKGLHIGESIHLEDIKLPQGVEPKLKWNFTLATVVGRAKQEEETTATAEEGAAVPAADTEAAVEGADTEEKQE